ncbi:MAG: hypothetical protein GQ527_05980 [Bacteroidales bacterium]|nr:hypothetical protein [Bacteroidales bacterium]
MNKTIVVNTEQSHKIGEIVGSLDFKDDFLGRKFLTLAVPSEIKTAMYYYAVGICHQTYHLANPKLNLYGWDFLEYGFMEIALQKPELLDAQYLVQLTPTDLIPLIKPFFAEDHIAEKCTLDTLEERAELWLVMAQFIAKTKKNHLEFVGKSKNDAQYFYQQLPQTIAYSDPLQKKTSFFMKLLEDSGLAQFGKNQELIPIMDYHMQRVLLRSGCVEVIDKQLKYSLQNREAIESDKEIREACIASMKIIAKTAGYSIFKMNDVFYTMGRSCCNESMLCESHKCEKTPCSLTLAVELGKHEHCIFQDICKGVNSSDYRKYWQPQVKTHFY